MKYPAYEKYKDSGVEWLGEVPETWRISPIKYLVSTPVTDGPHETPEILNEGIPFVSAEAINCERINFDKIRGYISEEDHKRFSKKYKPRKGDLYMVKSGATTGRIAMVETDIDFNIWSPIAAIRCNQRLVDRHFLYFYLQSKEFQTAVELSWSYGTQQNIGMGVIQNLSVPVPELKDQKAIADFLGHKTGRLDTLIEKKQALIEKLNEKRTALITRAVTKGLDESVPMKDSGIEWLGEVPEHWELKRLKFFAEFKSGENITSLVMESEGEYPVYGGNGLRG
jgi:type I restriction enzyme, S subunit